MQKKSPKISIITPTLNQAEFLSRTIESVLSQNYPNLEYIVIDGESRDETLKILKRYKDKLRWVSEKDGGQSDAINKGLRMAKGEILTYLNSDDILMPGALFKIAEFFYANNDIFWVTGKCRVVDKSGKELRNFVTKYKNFWLKNFRSFQTLSILNFISQPATFWRREVLVRIGYFDESLKYAMDYDYWLRICKIYKLGFIDDYIAKFRIHPQSKSGISYKKLLNEGWEVSNVHGSFFSSKLHKVHDLFTGGLYYIYKVCEK